MNAPDVVVIGGGIAGASVAYELAADRSVLLLEAEAEPGRHATGRSAATWIPGHGGAVLRALTAASGPRFAALAADLDAPPLLRPLDVLWTAHDEAGERALAALLAERAGEPDAPEAITVAQACALSPALLPGRLRAAARTSGAAVDTDALHRAYLRGLRVRGGELATRAAALAIIRDGAGWRVTLGPPTPASGPSWPVESADPAGAPVPGVHRIVTTGLVVDAAGAWADAVAALAGVRTLGLRALRRTIALARVPEPGRLGTAMVCEAGEQFYFKPEGDDLLISPADETPAEPGDARPDPLDVALALERVEEVTGLGLRSVRTAWAGLRTFAPDRAPVVGSWPGHPGFAFVAGQGGSGIETSPALAALAAAVITGKPPPADVPLDPARLAPDRR